MSDNKLIIKLGKCFLILTHYQYLRIKCIVKYDWNGG